MHVGRTYWLQINADKAKVMTTAGIRKEVGWSEESIKSFRVGSRERESGCER